MPDVGSPGGPGTGSDAAALAARHGLTQSGQRPALGAYVSQLWQRRHFILNLANAKTVSTYTNARLGQVWQVLTPLLNAAVYFLLFGILLGTKAGIENFTAYLIIGIFVFTFTQRAVLTGSRAINDHLGLIRALHFPRACLPLALTVVELQQLLVAMGVMAAIVLATGEPLTWAWVLVIPALLLQTAFNIGLSLAMARVGSKLSDVNQLLPFLLRTWLYTSGVFFSIDAVASRPNVPGWVGTVLEVNPGSVFIEIFRDALMQTYTAEPRLWFYAVGWAVVVFGAGLVYFWKAEETYGRG
jgi:teichoic acid transport system permease protein